MRLKRQQSGFFTIVVALFAAALVGSFLLSSLAQLVYERKKEQLLDEPAHLEAIAVSAMGVYAQNALAIEAEGPERAGWVAAPERLLEGAPIPSTMKRNRLGITMSPVRSYAGQGSPFDRAQYYAYTRAVLYLLPDSPNAAPYRPMFDSAGNLRECGPIISAGQACPYPSKLFELPVANWEAERLETAIRQAESLAQLLVTYFNAQILLDPVHEMATNHFRDPYCATGSQSVPLGRLPCLTGFVSLAAPGTQHDALIDLLRRAGITSTGLSELYYPWGTERVSKLELANEEGFITGTNLSNNVAYPYTFTIRQPLPWPAPDGTPTYVKVVAVQP